MHRRTAVAKSALLLSAIIAVAVISVAVYASQSPQSNSSTSTTTLTCPNPANASCVSPSNTVGFGNPTTTTISSVTLTTSNSDWQFEVLLSSANVTAGETIIYTCNLVNISGQNQTVVVANPISNPSLFTQRGQQVWAYGPSSTNAVEIVPPGKVLSLSLDIPTSGLHPGETYVLSSSPNLFTGTSSEAPLGQSLQLNETIIIFQP